MNFTGKSISIALSQFTLPLGGYIFGIIISDFFLDSFQIVHLYAIAVRYHKK